LDWTILPGSVVIFIKLIAPGFLVEFYGMALSLHAVVYDSFQPAVSDLSKRVVVFAISGHLIEDLSH